MVYGGASHSWKSGRAHGRLRIHNPVGSDGFTSLPHDAGVGEGRGGGLLKQPVTHPACEAYE